jgi:triphosphoribosyl-dephospho-CoA synthase
MTIDISAAAQLSCLLEASAPKPGNVSPGRHFADTRYEHFLASAAAIGAPLAAAASQPLGTTVLRAAQATSQWTRSNTNLGIVLLLAPLARAAFGGGDLRASLRRVLADTTVDDARAVYAAIRLASPGGLGSAGDQDVADEPTVTLIEAMRLAAAHDGIAREYASSFEVTFTTGAPTIMAARAAGLSWDDAVVETFLTILAASPDTHILRRGGEHLAADISQRAGEVLRAGGIRSEDGRKAITYFDHSLRDPRNIGNPGTTADLTAAAIFVALLEGAWT